MTGHKFGLGVLGFVLITVALTAGYGQKKNTDNNINEISALTFSNTQDWSEANLQQRDSQLSLLSQAEYKAITLPPPPNNSSAETQSELALLQSLSSNRSDDNQQQIVQELDFSGTPFGEITTNHLRALGGFDNSLELLMTAYNDLTILALKQKQLFDRVRPSFLDPTLVTAIPVPGHPAYPSAHAAQSRLIAYILSDLDSQNTNAYFAAADRIAHNREIAGVHYPSDSQAGKLLADSYYASLQKTTWYQTQLQMASSEWAATDEEFYLSP